MDKFEKGSADIEEALRKSEEQYRLIVETATEGIWIIDKEDRISFANKRITEMFGYTLDELMGKDVFTLMDDEWKVTARSDIKNLRARERQRHDFKFLRKDGNDLWTVVSATPLFDKNGQYAGALEMITGISERKRAEEASRATENKYRKLMEMASDAIFLVDAETGTIIDANKKAEELTGLSLDRLVGMNYTALHPKDKAKMHRRIFEEGAAKGKLVVTDAWVLRSDGKTVPVEIRGSLISLGRKKVMQGIFRDMSERLAAEESMRAGEERLRAMLDNSTALIYGRGMDGRYVFVNKVFEKLFHLKENRVLGNTPYDIFTKEIADMFQSTDIKVLETGKPLEAKETLPLPDGKHTYETMKFPLTNGGGRVYAMCSMATDITRHEKIEEELRKKNEQLAGLLAKYEAGPGKDGKKTQRKKHE